MAQIDTDLVLQEIPLFVDLTGEEKRFIGERSSFVEYKKGEVVYRQNAAADAFYCVILGRVVIYTTDDAGSDGILEYLHRGKYFGIISLLTKTSHSVSAKAVNDTVLLVIKKDDFDSVLDRIPRLAIDLSRTLSRRLKDKDVHRKTIFESTVISVYSSYSQAGKTVYALNLAISMKKETHKSVAILEIVSGDKIHSVPQRMGIGGDYHIFDLCDEYADKIRSVRDFIAAAEFGVDLMCLRYYPQSESCVRILVDILSLLVNDYHYIILDLPVAMDPIVFAILNQSDFIHILTSPEPVDLKKTHSLIGKLKEDFEFQEDKIKVIINEYKFSKLTHEQQLELLGRHVFATLPKIEFSSSDRLILDAPRGEYAMAIRRISRQVGERCIGLALGVGAAYGFCHIGVLKVIEEEKIPIDIICGSSVGALIASLWVTGRTSSEILEVTKEFKEPRYIWSMIDLTFPLLGFIKGDKLYKFLKKYLGDKTFYDTKVPLKIVASDVKKKEPKILDKGLLADAIMASCAMPGVFKPFKLKEEMLFDGGVINPLPTEPLFALGAKRIIAVNVTPSREDILRQYEKSKQELAAAPPGGPGKKARFTLKGYLSGMFKANILDIIFSSVELMQSEMIKKEAQFADVVLHPDTSGLHWLELHRAVDFAKRGEEETRKNLDRIRQVINE